MFSSVSSLAKTRRFNASTKSRLISSSLMWGVLQCLFSVYFLMHWYTMQRYLSVECHVRRPNQPPHSPHRIFVEKMLMPLNLVPTFFRLSISVCT